VFSLSNTASCRAFQLRGWTHSTILGNTSQTDTFSLSLLAFPNFFSLKSECLLGSFFTNRFLLLVLVSSRTSLYYFLDLLWFNEEVMKCEFLHFRQWPDSVPVAHVGRPNKFRRNFGETRERLVPIQSLALMLIFMSEISSPNDTKLNRQG